MAALGQHIRLFRALGAILYQSLRPLLRFLALIGVVVTPCFILINLTAVCIIPAGSAQFALAQVRLEEFNQAFEKYRLDCRRYPDSRMGLEALVSNPGVPDWKGPYVKGPLRDPWNRPFLYEVSGGIPIVRSLGADGKRGGDLFDADLSSQAPMAPIPESAYHAARRFFSFWIAPWLLLLAFACLLIRMR